jgi:hypothetical protein
MVDDGGQVVGNHEFFEKAPQHQPCGFPDLNSACVSWVLDLRQEIAGVHNWSGNHVGEERNEQGKIDGVLGWLNIPAVNVNDITDALEGIEGDAHRQYDLEMRFETGHAKHSEESAEGIDEKVKILKKAKEDEINSNTRGHIHLCDLATRLATDEVGQCPVGARREHEKPQEPPIPTGIKKVTGQQQHNVLAAVP